MKTTIPKELLNLARFLLFIGFVFSGVQIHAQNTDPQVQDSVKTGVSLGKIILKNPESIVSKYTYDPILDLYFYNETVGDFNINYPVILTPEQYRKLIQKENMRDYFKQKIDAVAGKKEGSEEAQKNLLPNFYVNSNFFESIFGGNTIEVIPQGSVAMDLGIRFQKNDNPALSPRNRTNLTFDFDQRISLSLLGKVGTRLAITANYDTEATFDFQNLIKLEYTPTEDDILQKIEIGNVNMPLNSSLITGAQSLFGVKTELQFGRTRITGVFSEQRSQSRSIVAQGGGTLTDFEILALDYDEDRHFFLSQFFRDQYDIALESYPFIRSQVQITRIEIWVTNRGQRTDNVRNIVAIQDIGEFVESQTRLGLNNQDPPGFFNVNSGQPNELPRNNANDFNPFAIGTANSVLTEAIREIATVRSGFGSLSSAVNEGFDYAILENARKLEEGRDFSLNTQLGYISLNQRLSNDEVLAVAFQYTFAGEVYQVGEFAADGIGATGFDPNNNDLVNNTLVLKLLKSNITNVSDPIWDLMMKNIYSTGAFQLSPEDFRLNILYTDPSPLNYLSPVDEATFPEGLDERILLDVLNFDRLNIYNDPQSGGDGFFDFIPGITVDPQSGNIIFTKVEPFGEFLHGVLGGGDYENPSSYNPNQEQYVFRNMYELTKAAALEDSDQDKFQLKGRYKSQGSSGIPIGAFNVPRGSVRVTAGGRLLQEGIDYTVNYQAGTVQILDDGLRASNVPIEVSVENNAIFGQQTRRFSGVNIEHQFTDNFVLGATLLNLNERPLTQKANFGVEPVNNTIFGFNGNFSTEVPFLTRLANKLPNIDTDVPSNLSVRGEIAYLLPGSPKNADFEGETTAYLDDFEGAQSLIDVRGPLAWTLASPPLEFLNNGQPFGQSPDDPDNLLNGHGRAKLSWYTIDPIFYTNLRPSGVSDDDISLNQTRRVFIDEIFPQVDVPQGQTTVQNTLDLAYYPDIKGPYNNNPQDLSGLSANEKWGGIMRAISSTNFEQANVEFIQFWVLDPYVDGVTGNGGELVFNLGNISEDILTDGRKQYENGLPVGADNNSNLTSTTSWGEVPSTQSLVYAFDANPDNRTLQDIGFDGLDDQGEASIYVNNPGNDPALDNYQYYLDATGGILERYFNFNNPDGNSPVTVTNTDRGSTTLPDVEDVDRDLTLNTVNSYFEYRIPIRPNIQRTDQYVTDIRELERPVPNNGSVTARWIQFKIPIREFTNAIGGITDIRSISFMRMYLTGFQEEVVLRFGTLDLVRGDYRFYTRSLQEDQDDPSDDGTFADISTVNIQENEQRQPIPYRLPPGVQREQLNNNNTIIRQNEQSIAYTVCDLQPRDARAAFKNINVDLRQYKRLQMFLHAEAFQENTIFDNDLVGFIRIGTDFNDNYYQVEVPLQVTRPGASTAEEVWPELNNMDIPLSLLSRMKAVGIANGTLNQTVYYDEELNVVNEFDPREAGRLRLGLRGNPSLGNIRALMIGVKNTTTNEVCGEVWFNELRLSELDNKGGWAAIAAIDANMADFANVSATGQISTIGFGAIEQLPNERSREESIQYGVNTNINVGQLFPKKWGLQIPVNYSISEQLVTPEFDPVFQDITLEDRIDAVETEQEKEITRRQAEDYTKRRSINLIGLRKNRSEEAEANFFDIENFTFNYSYNEVNHRDFEIEDQRDQNVRAGLNYVHAFKPAEIAPFKKSDSLLTGRYWQWLKDLNLNLLPTSISVNSNINRTFNQQRFRDVLSNQSNPNDLGLPLLQQRNFLFDWQYSINYNLTKSLQFNFVAANFNIVRNYFGEDEDGNVIIREDVGVYDDFFNTGEANRHTQQLQVNYELPLNKIPTFSFINATYSYTGNFDWQRGGEALNEIAGEDLNTIQNANTHTINAALGMDKLYEYLGLTKITAADLRKGGRGGIQRRPPIPGQENEEEEIKKTSKFHNTLVDILTPIKRINLSYTENNGKVLPGYTESIGFIGTLRPSFGFVFGSQADVRFEAARRGWLTTFPEFNQQYLERTNRILNITANALPIQDLTIDLVADRQFSESYAENFRINENNGAFDYEVLVGNRFGDFSISTVLLSTAFAQSDEMSSETFEEFRANRLRIANRLAVQNGIDINDPNQLDADGFPRGYGKNNQAVLLPAFLAAYTGTDPDKINTGAFRDVPIPNWTIKYTGFMRLKWFKKNFRRFSLTHGYRSSYSLNSFRTNLEFDPTLPPNSQIDQAGNFLNETVFTNATLVEQFNPLMRVDFEMKNSLSVQAEVKRDRALSLSFDNNLLTEITGKEYIIGLGYRVKDLRFRTNIGGKRTTLKGDLNLKADLALRDNITVIRNLDIENNQVTAGQNIWSLKFTADYALSKNLTTLFFYDHTFSEFAISTAFPQTTIRSGFTLRYNFGN
ncbi:cell surface protein SprA [Ascidiimonas aurantiaca]|uniref:T9SS outer membrane translocon Sov/SprA n=1 Tax=Ascidiimonas aurantiaca TaxID=1685432 RepID=UPI003BB7DA5D